LGAATDFLICAVAAGEHLQILTSDSDFLRCAEHLPIRVCGTTPWPQARPEGPDSMAENGDKPLDPHSRMCYTLCRKEFPMATNLALDDKLIEQARAAGGHRTKKEAVTSALQEYIARRKQRGVLKLAGKIEFDPSYRYKEARRR
jgi:Arc/MetJ family transcription regulator